MTKKERIKMEIEEKKRLQKEYDKLGESDVMEYLQNFFNGVKPVMFDGTNYVEYDHGKHTVLKTGMEMLKVLNIILN